MRRIIAGLSIAALFACSDTRTDGDSRPDAAAADSGDAPTANAEAIAATRTIIFLGTSLTAGYGVGPDVAYPALIQQRITAERLPFRITNAGISGETSAGGLRRIDWLLQNPVDVLVLELGANDGLRGLDTDSLRQNLDQILTRTRAKYPDAAIVMLGMEAPPNLGTPYTTRFRQIYTDLAQKHRATLVPFLLDGVAGNAAQNQEDGIHPNQQGHRTLADNVWAALRPVLVERSRRAS